jgi:hypothetical protein
VIRGTRDDLIWLAGLFEGEVCVDAHRGKYPRVRLGMTDRDVVARAADLMGANLRLALHPAPNAATWHAEVAGERAAELMRDVLPFMGARRSAKIAEVLGIHAFRHVPAEGKRRHPSSTPGPSVSAVRLVEELEVAA